MYEVTCPSCSAHMEYNPDDYIHLCPYCSAGFILDLEEGAKHLISDHYILPNRCSKEEVEDIFRDWLKTRYHHPETIKKEFEILGSYGISLPYWIISIEAHSIWSGHSRKAKDYPGQLGDFRSRYVQEKGHFSRRYRWCLLARHSPKEHWGLERLHFPQEKILVDWDGFPLDESMGKADNEEKSVYDYKQNFNFDNANGLPIMGVETNEMKAIMRAKDQVNEYHRRMCKKKVGTLFEHKTEVEVIGVQLIHLPFWVVRYGYSPKSAFRFFTNAREKFVIVQGYTKVVLDGEFAVSTKDRIMINLFVCVFSAIFCLGLGLYIHPAFFILVAAFASVAVLSTWKVFSQEPEDGEQQPGRENFEPVSQKD